jgi:ubiquinone/menaquinone biosynthesis C-methylase UbiE
VDHHRGLEECLRVLQPGGHFFSQHFSSDSTADLQAIFPGLGTYVQAEADELESALVLMGFCNVSVEEVSKTYRNRSVEVGWLICEAEKR